MRRLTLVLVLATLALVAPWLLIGSPVVEAASAAFTITWSTVSSPATAGRAATVEARVQARAAGSATVEVVIRDAQQAVAWQQRWSDQRFSRWQTQVFKAPWAIPDAQPAGGYTLTVRVLDGSDRELAPNRVSPFKIKAPAPAPAPTAPPPTPTPPAPTPTPTPAPGVLEPEEAAFLALINDYRRSNGLGALTVDVSLNAASEWMSADMAAKGYFAHTDSLGRDPFQRMAAFGYTAATWKGENIAAGYGSAAQVFEGWRTSAGHNANMLNGNYRTIGIGRAARAGSPYGVYWTTDFGGQ